MMSARDWQGGALVLLIATQASLPILRSQEPLHRVESHGDLKSADEFHARDLIEELDDDSYATRQLAAFALARRALLEWLPAGSSEIQPSDRCDTLGELRGALHHSSLEVRLAAAKILRQVAREAQQVQLNRLLNPHCDAATIRLEYWDEFSRLAGDDLPSRQAFAALVRRCLGGFRQMPTKRDPQPAHRRDAERRDNEHRSDNELLSLAVRVDPYMLDPQDTPVWMTLLMLDLQREESLAHLTPRLSIALSHDPMGPAPSSNGDAVVMHRMIRRWIGESSNLCGQRERLLIALRYDCHDVAGETCGTVLNDLESPASLVATGLLVASVLQRADLPAHAIARLDDDRVACVWQLIPSRQTKIVTEVRDVALAVLLHHHGIDPRDAGFQDLQADPVLCFQDQSLGFSDATARDACRWRSARLLSRSLSDEPVEMRAYLRRLGETRTAD